MHQHLLAQRSGPLQVCLKVILTEWDGEAHLARLEQLYRLQVKWTAAVRMKDFEKIIEIDEEKKEGEKKVCLVICYHYSKNLFLLTLSIPYM